MTHKQVGGTHYEEMSIQPKDFIHKNKLDFFEGNVVKYITRHRVKNGEQDVRKAIDYAIMVLENDYGVKVSLVDDKVTKKKR